MSQSIVLNICSPIINYANFIYSVPAILSGPMNTTLEYSDNLTASFTCTVFGGSGTDIVFLWYITNLYDGEPQNDFNSIVETLNADNSITSTVITSTLSVGSVANIFEVFCCVHYNGSNDVDCEEATMNIGKRDTSY